MINSNNKTITTVIILLCTITFSIYSYEEKDHKIILHEILFGETYSTNTKTTNTKINLEKVELLDKACYLTIDFCKGKEIKGQRYLNDLPLDEKPQLKELETPGGSSHQRYTHRGWSETYYTQKKYQKIWEIRKNKVLLETINYICGNYNGREKRKKELFGELVYYIHILGDHKGDSITTSGDRMELVPRKDSQNQVCIIDELIDISKELFGDQDYSNLVQELGIIKKTNIGTSDVKNVATKTISVLSTHIPELLYKEDFFRESFYSSENESENEYEYEYNIDWEKIFRNYNL